MGPWIVRVPYSHRRRCSSPTTLPQSQTAFAYVCLCFLWANSFCTRTCHAVPPRAGTQRDCSGSTKAITRVIGLVQQGMGFASCESSKLGNHMRTSLLVIVIVGELILLCGTVHVRG